jgi:hypothetical protein
MQNVTVQQLRRGNEGYWKPEKKDMQKGMGRGGSPEINTFSNG